MRCACLVAVLCVMLLAACGADADKAPGPAAGSPATTEAPEPAAGAPEPETTESPEPEPAESPEPEPEADERQSETLPELPGTEVDIGRVYDGPMALKVSAYGVAFKLPQGFRTGLDHGQPAFGIQATERLGVGVIVMRRQVAIEDVRAEMREPQDFGDGVILRPQGQVQESDGRLSVWYGDGQYLAKCVALLSERGNGVAFFFGADAASRDWISRTVTELADGVTLGIAAESQTEQEWRNLLAGQKLTYIHSSYSSDYSGGSVGSSTRIEISLHADGRFEYTFRDSFTVTTPGATGHGRTPSRDQGQWSIELAGAAVHLVLAGNETRRYALSLSSDRLFLDNRRYFRTPLE
jgi:hypothetical protein